MEYRVLPEKLMTADDLLHLEDDEWFTELVEGRLVREPIPGPEHGQIMIELGARLAAYAKPRKLGVVFAHSGYKLRSKPDTVRGPDVSFVSAARLPATGVPREFLQLSPDLAVEIVSPSNTAREIMRKVLEYLTAGTRIVWVVDPSTRSVTVYPGREHIRILQGQDELDGGSVLPGFRVTVEALLP
jgi:Uma2 family endonuclease